MSTSTTNPPTLEVPAGSRRRRRLAAVSLALLALVALVVWLVTRDAEGSPSASDGTVPASETPAAQTPAAQTPAAQTPAAQTPAADAPAAGTAAEGTPAAGSPAAGGESQPAPAATAASLGPDGLPVALPPVALDQEAGTGDGVTVRLDRIEAVQGTGTGPGNIGGPALRLTVALTNGSSAPLSLDGVQVTMTSGADQAPASPLNDPSANELDGVLAPGGSVTGTYVFRVPQDQRDVVSVTVGHTAAAPLLVFTGPAA
ncbi:hypothetical protein [Modestobacter sp. SSW1-42]|uniref:hypothetical protein n=1 Tax=Modestobacter sp. SSW1-42 TaxID=596372 RepID=UPI003986263D